MRSIDHLLYAIKLGSHIITSPFVILKEWGKRGLPMPGTDYEYRPGNLREIPYEEIDLSKTWQEYNIRHELTDKGMERFSEDWNSLIG